MSERNARKPFVYNMVAYYLTFSLMREYDNIVVVNPWHSFWISGIIEKFLHENHAPKEVKRVLHCGYSKYGGVHYNYECYVKIYEATLGLPPSMTDFQPF
jgi:hypothetical protein